IVTELAAPRKRVEYPELASRENVEAADVSGSPDIPFAGCRAKNDDVLVDHAGRPGRGTSHELWIDSKPFPKIDDAFVSEGRDRLTGERVDREQRIASFREKN